MDPPPAEARKAGIMTTSSALTAPATAPGASRRALSQLFVATVTWIALGALVTLIVLALEKLFTLSASRLFRWFFWIYNAGVLLTGAMMTWHGILDVQKAEASKAISGIAGAGHILIGAGFVLLLITLWKGIRRSS